MANIFLKRAFKQMQQKIDNVKDKIEAEDKNFMFWQFLKFGAEFARSICPVGETGNLARSIKFKIVDDIGYIYSDAISYTTTSKGGSIVSATPTPYLKFVEFGTGVKGLGGQSSVYRPQDWIQNKDPKGWTFLKAPLDDFSGGGTVLDSFMQSITKSFIHTYGIEPKPIMYLTKRFLQQLKNSEPAYKNFNVNVIFHYDILPFNT